MARKIKFALKMKDDSEVRTLEDLKEHFDLESVLGYFTDGRLKVWLEDRYEKEKALAIEELNPDAPDLAKKLCEIIGVSHNEDIDVYDIQMIKTRNEKYNLLSKITTDNKILDNIDSVAMNESELEVLLSQRESIIYLYGNKFLIPYNGIIEHNDDGYEFKNIKYIGINNPIVGLEDEKSVMDYYDMKIDFENVTFDESSLPYPYYSLGENLFLEGKYKEAFPLIEEEVEKGNPRAMYIASLIYSEGYNIVKISEEKRNRMCENAVQLNYPLLLIEYYRWYTVNLSNLENKWYYEGNNHFNDQCTNINGLIEILKKYYDLGDVLSCCALGDIYCYGINTDINFEEAEYWYTIAADKGISYAQNALGYLYFDRTCQYTKAMKYFEKACEQGNARAQYFLGYIFWYGEDEYENQKIKYSIPKDIEKTVNYFEEAADQEYAPAQICLGYIYHQGDLHHLEKWKLAAEYYKRAIAHGNKDARLELEIMKDHNYTYKLF